MTSRLTDLAVTNWRDLEGWSLTHGVPELASLTLGRFSSVVWHWATRNLEPDQRVQFEAKVWQPPVGQVGRGIWSAEAEMAAFAAVESALQ